MKIITLKNTSKKYFLTPGRAVLLRDIFLPPEKKVVLALKSVSLTIEKGQCVGIIGENGSGKSTLLRVIASITHPSSGRINVEGMVGSIIELGAGFHPDLTGKENVYLGGALMGFSKSQLDEKYPQILEFSGLSEFIDQPIRTYSSGMVVRLAFSIAVALDPDILLIDEVLAVGDEAFQKKCIDKILDFKNNKKTILFVSHDLSLVYHVCPLCIWMHKGNLMLFGKTPKVIAGYTKSLPRGTSGILARGRWGNQQARITQVTLINSQGQKTNFFDEGEAMTISVKIRFLKKVENPVFGLTIKNEAGKNFFQTNTIWKQIKTGIYKKGSTQKAEFVFAENFPEGKYYVSPAVAESNLKSFYDWRENLVLFEVGRRRPSGTLAPRHLIKI